MSRSEVPLTTAVYRGWMLSVEQYDMLYATLARRGVELINTPEQYRHCHLLPESYELIKPKSPATVWIPANAGAVNAEPLGPQTEKDVCRDISKMVPPRLSERGD